jgi:hypothetical protein
MFLWFSNHHTFLADMQSQPRFTSPLGVLGFPSSIHEPDNKFADDTDPNDLGDYKARLFLDNEEAAEFKQTLENIWTEFYEAELKDSGKKSLKVDPDLLPWFDETDDNDEPTGRIGFRFKLKARVKKRDGTFFDQRPKVFDTSNQLIREVPNIGLGSQVKIAGRCKLWRNPSKMGMTLWLEGVQLHKLIEGGQGTSADSFGFTGEANGFTDESSGSDF